MTQVRLPPQLDGARQVVPARVRVTLVGADRRTPLVAVRGQNLAVECLAGEVTTAAGLVVELAPTAELALITGSASWYRADYGAPGRPEVFHFQVPQSASIVEATAQIGAATIDPGQIVDIAATVVPHFRALSIAMAVALG